MQVTNYNFSSFHMKIFSEHVIKTVIKIKNGAKSITKKEFKPSLVALFNCKTENYRAHLVTNNINPKAVYISCQLH